MATELAVHGFNLVIHGRNAEKLAKVQAELQAAHTGVDVVVVCADASQRIEDWAALLAPLQELHITILINNVGNSQTGAYFPLDRVSDDDIYTLIHTNDIFPTVLTKHMLPKLIANSPGLILNIGSFAGAFGVPLLSVYSGTKAYNLSFSRAIRNDLRLLGHDVQCKAVFVVRPLPLQQNALYIHLFPHIGQRIHEPQHCTYALPASRVRNDRTLSTPRISSTHPPHNSPGACSPASGGQDGKCTAAGRMPSKYAHVHLSFLASLISRPPRTAPPPTSSTHELSTDESCSSGSRPSFPPVC